ncbi:hypothetical protein FA13DRAFT_1732539 [Coprinellus micaceus]|uniref:Uncharacterized protein n=1 Tax=Coprinellus micaceus TaxID=71717 RepID=A0A4Y7TBW7_COPMI|nr:hypothetical protein FA13DRAFT_1732539 [Coprinellus micaceus]
MTSKTQTRSYTIDNPMTQGRSPNPLTRTMKNSTSVEQMGSGTSVLHNHVGYAHPSMGSIPSADRGSEHHDEGFMDSVLDKRYGSVRGRAPTVAEMERSPSSDRRQSKRATSNPLSSSEAAFRVQTALEYAGSIDYQTTKLSIIQVAQDTELHQDLIERSEFDPDALLRFLMQSMTVRSTFDAERVTKRGPKLTEFPKVKLIAGPLKDLNLSSSTLEGLQRRLEDPTQTPVMNNAFVNVGEVRGRDIAILDVAFLREAGEDIPDAHLLYSRLKIEASVRPPLQKAKLADRSVGNTVEFVVAVEQRAFCLRDLPSTDGGDDAESLGATADFTPAARSTTDGKSKKQHEALVRFLRMLGQKGKKVAHWDAMARRARSLATKTKTKGSQGTTQPQPPTRPQRLVVRRFIEGA